MSHRDALKELRQAVFDRGDQDASQTVEAVERVDRFINLALKKVCLDAPFLFFEEQVRISTQPDVEPDDEDDTISIVSDDEPGGITNPWTFRFDTPLTDPDPGTDMLNDRSWDGRKIDIIDPDTDEVIQTNQIRTVWVQTIGDEVHWHLTVWHPFPVQEHGTGPFNWRIYTEAYYFPDDVVEFKSVRVVGQDSPQPLRVVGQDEAEESGIVDSEFAISAGQPAIMYRRGHFQMPSPNTAPDVSILDPDDFAWEGPEPAGEFEYCFTLTWGKRDLAWQAPGVGKWNQDLTDFLRQSDTAFEPDQWDMNRYREPLWESSPSPISSSITSVNGQTELDNVVPAGAIGVLLPNIEYMLGFMLSGSKRVVTSSEYSRIHSAHSGWHYRIYRRRKTEDYDYYENLGVDIDGQNTFLQKLDIQDAFFLIAEIRIDLNGGSHQFVDQGSIIPDYNRRLRNVHGYQGFGLYPRPDARYVLDARVIRRPQPLVSESDAPPIHPEAIQLLIDQSMVHFFQNAKDPASAAEARAQYERGLETLRKRYGDARPASQPLQRAPARHKGYNRIGHKWWRRSS